MKNIKRPVGEKTYLDILNPIHNNMYNIRTIIMNNQNGPSVIPPVVSGHIVSSIHVVLLQHIKNQVGILSGVGRLSEKPWTVVINL